ncbi:MAG: hypothetical protein ABIR94_01745 [Rubrivivax sp.]
MSTRTIQGHRAVSPATPLFAGMAHKLSMSLQRYGYRRAAGHLQLLSDQYRFSNPTLALQMSRAAADCRASGTLGGATGDRG